MKEHILALDQGTTSSRAIIFDRKGCICSIAQKEFRQIFPKPGWVEHNPCDIWETQLYAARLALEKSKISAEDITAIGIANQRETLIAWERKTGKPVSNAIVWQCRRTSKLCKQLKDAGLENEIHKRTGLFIDPYFSGTKIIWMLNENPILRKQAEKREVLFGTVDSWLLYNLTGKHLTDPSNASRTLLFNIHKGIWDKEILKELNIPEAALPRVIPSSGQFGTVRKELFGCSIPVSGVIGDQQAALFGQACFDKGSVKNTYGTGCFALMHTGTKAVYSKNNLLTTIAWDIGRGLEYALEGSVFIGGAVIQWLRDKMKIIDRAEETEAIALSVTDTSGVYFVPAFVGLGAPYWNPDVRGTLVGLTRGTEKAHIVRASLESIAFQTMDLFEAMKKDTKEIFMCVKVDGGACRNNFLMQFQSDILNLPIERPVVSETTALGAAYMAGLACGVWNSPKEIKKNWQLDKIFLPQINPNQRDEKLCNWKKAVSAANLFTTRVTK